MEAENVITYNGVISHFEYLNWNIHDFIGDCEDYRLDFEYALQQKHNAQLHIAL